MDLLTRLRAAFHAFNHPEEQGTADMATIKERLAALEARPIADGTLGDRLTNLEKAVNDIQDDIGTDPAPEQAQG